MLGLTFGLKGMALAAAVALVVGNLSGGAAVRIYYRGVIAAGEARAAKTDAKAANELNDSAGKTAKEIAADDAHNANVTRDPLPGCPLGPDGARRLLELR